MNEFGIKSLGELATCDERLATIAQRVLRIKDHSIIKGHRDEQQQNAAFYAMPQRSKLKWPDGKHNGLPSQAMDVQTWPVPIGDTEEETDQLLREEQLYLLGLYVGVGAIMGIPIRTGSDWDQDGEIADTSFDDFFHVELIEG